jgi:hypothetical protein
VMKKFEEDTILHHKIDDGKVQTIPRHAARALIT